MKYTIYKTTNLVNNKIYIGKHKTKDSMDDYLGSGKHLNNSIEKYGRDKFKKEILFDFDTEEEMNNMEAEIVDEIFVARLDTYNIKLGGQGGWDHVNSNDLSVCFSVINDRRNTDIEYQLEHTKKISNGVQIYYKELRNSELWDEFCIQNSKNLKTRFLNKRHTEESKAKIGKANSKHQSGSGNVNYGKCWIYNLELCQSKSISKEELQYWLDEGWIKGRKFNFDLEI